LCGRELGTRALEHLSLSLCCESASGLFAQELSNYCDYCQHLKCWIEVSIAHGSICSSHLLVFVSLSVRLDLYLHTGEGRSSYGGSRQGTKTWINLALVLVRTRPSGQRLCGFRSCVGRLVIGRSASLRLFNRRLLTCILLSDSQHLHTHNPLSLSLLASV